MKKKLLILCACAVLVACSNENKEVKINTNDTNINSEVKTEEKRDEVKNEIKEDENVKFSALGGENSQNLVADLLKKSEIDGSIINSFISDVKAYNEYTGNDFDDLVDLKPIDYNDMLDKAKLKSSKKPLGIGNNCRITTFELMKNNISISGNAEEKTSMLDFDLASLKEQNKFSDDELKDFTTYYAAIKAEDSSDYKVQLQKIKDALKERGIEFKKGSASIVSVYLNSKNEFDGNILFVGHTGVLVEDNDKLYFVEKLSFEEPYQLVVFNNRSEVIKYLTGKYDLPLGENTSKAMIFENGELIDGFK